MIELNPDGRLTQELINTVGDEYTVTERLTNKYFGIGQLRYSFGNSVLDAFYERHNYSIKAHFDWTKKGAVIRLRSMSSLYALGLEQKGFRKIILTKFPDWIYAIPGFPFWLLLRLGVSIRIAKWFRIRGDRFDEGKCVISIEHSNTCVNFELTGDLWKHCLQTFDIERIKHVRVIDDQRTWMTSNGFRIKAEPTPAD